MKSFLKSKLILFVFKFVLSLVLLFLPAIPIWVQPVVLDSIASLRWRSLWQILDFEIQQFDGITYHYAWYSIASLVGLLAVLIVIWVGFRRVKN